MGTTNFDTVGLGGIATLSGAELSGIKAAVLRGGTIYCVDANAATSGNGLSWSTAFATLAEAYAVIDSGDTIVFRGKIREQLITPVGIFDVTVIGAGNRPRHADVALSGYGNTAANTWTYPASGATTAALCKVLHQGWRFLNILFAPPTDHCGLWLYRGGTPDTAAERDASHAEVIGCRFAAGQDGIWGTEAYNVGIFDSSFQGQTGYALKHVAGDGIAAPYFWQIKRNRFNGCANWMGVWAARDFEIMDNTVSHITTLRLDTRTGAGHNIVTGNKFDIAAADFDDTGGVYGAATDTWSNTLLDTIETGVPA